MLVGLAHPNASTHSFADWSRIPADVDISFFDDHCATESDLVERLLPFEIVGIMRERTAFPRHVLSRLPNLRLIVSTGCRNPRSTWSPLTSWGSPSDSRPRQATPPPS